MKRIVHLDLKGAPLQLQYLEKILRAIKSWGGTGILIEWEDTFPYGSDLLDVGSQCGGGDGMYTWKEVKYILQLAKANGLEPIQLIQTIGHMEFVLKHPAFRGLREAPRSPAVLCPSNTEARGLVREMLIQALDVQPDAAYLHIGADEVWHTAICRECQHRAALSKHQTASLYLEHIRDVAIFLKQKKPDLTVLMWDDMLRSISLETLMTYRLGELVEPVIWHYNAIECFQIDPNLWNNYSRLFSKVWAGSAFKGANGSCQIVSPVTRYVRNQEAWVREIQNNSHKINFDGIILTGWSRYDHYATLCELMPVSLPSLASCLRFLTKTDNVPNEQVVSDVLPSDEWPGEELARCVHAFVELKARCHEFTNGDLITTWLNPWQISHNYTNPVQVEGIAIAARQLLREIKAIQSNISSHIYDITGLRSADEWLGTYVTPLVRSMTELCETAESRYQSEASVTP